MFEEIDISDIPKGKKLITGRFFFKRKFGFDIFFNIYKKKFKA